MTYFTKYCTKIALFLLPLFILTPSITEAQLVDPTPEVVFAAPGFYVCSRDTDEGNDDNADPEELRTITETRYLYDCFLAERVEIETNNENDEAIYERWTYEYDDLGRIIKETEVEDDDYDGITPTIDETKMARYTYDGNGNIMRIDLNEDGDTDYVTFAYTYTSGDITMIVRYDSEDNNLETYTYTYGPNGVATAMEEEDQGDNGTVDEIKKWTYTYDGSGRLTMILEEEDDNYDGTTFTVRETQKTTYTYDGATDRILNILEEDDYMPFPLDGTPDESSDVTYTYDGNGNITSAVEIEDNGNEEAEIYGYCEAICVAPIPTLSQWGLIILFFLLASIGLVFIKQRFVSNPV